MKCSYSNKCVHRMMIRAGVRFTIFECWRRSYGVRGIPHAAVAAALIHPCSGLSLKNRYTILLLYLAIA